jgi:hypothetical protein
LARDFGRCSLQYVLWDVAEDGIVGSSWSHYRAEKFQEPFWNSGVQLHSFSIQTVLSEERGR